jgi:hypothetical protein
MPRKRIATQKAAVKAHEFDDFLDALLAIGADDTVIAGKRKANAGVAAKTALMVPA